MGPMHENFEKRLCLYIRTPDSLTKPDLGCVTNRDATRMSQPNQFKAFEVRLLCSV